MISFEINAAESPPNTGALLWAQLAPLPLRHLDVALARWVAERDPSASAPLLLAVVWLAHLEGRGHTCLDLAALHAQPAHELAWPSEHTPALGELHRCLPATPAAWAAVLAASPLVWCVDHGADLGQPLVLWSNTATPSSPHQAPCQRLYLRRYWRWEQAVAQGLIARSRALLPSQGASAQHLRPWLQRLFPTQATAHYPNTAPPALTPELDWQQLACAVALSSGVSVVTGGPGTGKTYTAARLLVALLATAPHADTLRVALAAPTGKAAARLKQSIDQSLHALAPLVADVLDVTPLIQRMGAATTLHRLLGVQGQSRQWRHGAANPLALDVLIVDEASMIHLEMMAALLAALPPHAQLVLLGDKDQLDSVEAGAVLGDLCSQAAQGHYTPATQAHLFHATGTRLPQALLHTAATPAPPLAQHTVMLRRSRRFDGPIGQLAQAVNEGDAPKAESLLLAPSATGGPLRWHMNDTPHAAVQAAVHGRSGAQGGYLRCARLVMAGPQPVPPTEDANANANADPDAAAAAAHSAWVHAVLDAFEQVRVLCATRDGAWGVMGLNEAIATELARASGLRMRGEWYAGRPVMITRNDPDLGVFNGDIGLTLPAPPRPQDGQGNRGGGEGAGGPRWRVYFRDGQALRSVGVGRLAHIETAFALTVHKSQGSEFDHTVLVLPRAIGPLLNRPLVYTGITRAKTALTLVTPDAACLYQALRTQASRHSGLGDALHRVAADAGHRA